jgi:putative transposase
MRKNFSITELCEALGVSRSGYHKVGKREPSKRRRANQQLLHRMRIIHSDRHTRCYGSPRMTRKLRAVGIDCSENRVARIMRLNGLRARPRRPFRPKTTQSDHAAHPSPNLLSEAGSPSAPGAQLVSDIDSGLVPRGAIFHSDRGCQYSATMTRELLARHGLRQSMSAKGYCYDNAFSESAFAFLKSEVLSEGLPFDSKRVATTALFDYFETFYNRRRLHSSLGYLSPNAFLNRHFQNYNPHLN